MADIIKKTIKFDQPKDRYLIVMLTASAKDWGFFDVDESINYVYNYALSNNFLEIVNGIGLDNLL